MLVLYFWDGAELPIFPFIIEFGDNGSVAAAGLNNEEVEEDGAIDVGGLTAGKGKCKVGGV